MIDKATTSVDQCPECQGDVQVAKGVVLGRLVTCPHCQAGLQVVSISPFHLDWFDVEVEHDKAEAAAGRHAPAAAQLSDAGSVAPGQAKKAASAGSAACPECQAPVRAKRIKKLGQELRCRECDKLLTVISLKPLQLEWLAEEPALRPFELKAQRKKPVSLRQRNHKSDFDSREDMDYDYN